MAYSVKEIFYTLQGEGAQSGRPAVFCRFTGCNLWSGLEKDRLSAVCKFCDTDFVGTDGQNGGKFSTPKKLSEMIEAQWPGGGSPYVVFTGGEPLLQLDNALIREVKAIGFEIAIETNGTLRPPNGVDWVCVSPKAGSRLVLNTGNELKLVYPQLGADPSEYVNLKFSHFFLQPLDNHEREKNTQKALGYCLDNPVWKLSLQSHKILAID